MKGKCESCTSCGMPFERAEDHALGDENIPYCKYCTREDGTLKSYEEVLEGMSNYLVHSQGIDKTKASLMAKQILAKLPAWSLR